MAQQEIATVPKGWVQGTASDLVLNPKNDIVDGPFGSNLKASEYTDSGTPIVRIQNVKRFRFIDKNIHFVTDEKAKQLKRHSFIAGDVLITKLGEPLGLACIAPERFDFGIIVADIVRARPYVEISNQFITYLLNSRVVIEQISKHTKGSTRARINLSVVRNLNIPIPPLPEQKRIVEKLDSLLAQVDTIQQRLNNLPNIIKRFRQSVLAAAVSGKLTEQWREGNNTNTNFSDLKQSVINTRKELGFKAFRKIDKINVDSVPFEIPNTWDWAMMGDISLKITDGAHNTPKVLGEGHPYLMAKDLTKGNLDFSENRFISEKDHKELYNKCRPQIGDLLIVNIGAGTGNNVTVNVDYEFSFKNIAIIKKPDFIESKYLKWYFDSQKQRIFNEQTRGGAQPFMSLTVLNNIKFALPPLEEQTEIVRLVEQYFALADTLEKNLTNAKKRVDNLTQSILAKAFKGELVPQDPNDESAEKLLARIKIARLEVEKLEKAAKKATNTKKRTAKKG